MFTMNAIGNEVIRLKEVDSTNLYLAQRMMTVKPGEGTVVIAENQTAGRGLDNNTWESEPSKNLTFSFILYPFFLAVADQFYLNKIISLGLADVFRKFLPDRTDIRIKWPNDIYIGDYKAAGTLVQNGVKGDSFEYTVIGIGLNVNQEVFRSDAPNPISLKMASGHAFDLQEVFQESLASLNHRYEMLKNGRRPEIDRNYLDLLYRLNQIERYLYKDNEIRAKIKGVNRYGQLVLEKPDEEIIVCDLKEIQFIFEP